METGYSISTVVVCSMSGLTPCLDHGVGCLLPCMDYVLFYSFESAATTDTTREEFEARKKALLERSNQKTNVPKQLSSAGKVNSLDYCI